MPKTGLPCLKCGSLNTIAYTDDEAYEFVTKANLQCTSKGVRANKPQISFTGRFDLNQAMKTVQALAEVAKPFAPIIADKLKKKRQIELAIVCLDCGNTEID